MDIFQPSSMAPTVEDLARWRQTSPLMDYQHAAIQRLITQRGWMHLTEHERIGAVYNFVRDDIAFGYNASDDLPASTVLSDGIGQCNTKGTLLRPSTMGTKVIGHRRDGAGAAPTLAH